MRRLTFMPVAAAVLAAFALPPLAAAAVTPSVSTGAPSGQTVKTATLNGTVNPNGAPTSYWFEYGTSRSYGLRTGSRDAGSGDSNRPVSAGVSGLSASTTYHFRLIAQNAAGTARGADQTFTTPAAATPAAATGAASATSAKTATLNGTVNPNGGPTSYWFEYGTSASYGLQTGARVAGAGTTAQQLSVNISGLSAGTTHHFRLVAQNAAGTSDGLDQTFATSAAAASAPQATTGSASDVLTATAILHGALSANGAPTRVPVRHVDELQRADEDARR